MRFAGLGLHVQERRNDVVLGEVWAFDVRPSLVAPLGLELFSKLLFLGGAHRGCHARVLQSEEPKCFVQVLLDGWSE